MIERGEVPLQLGRERVYALSLVQQAQRAMRGKREWFTSSFERGLLGAGGVFVVASAAAPAL